MYCSFIILFKDGRHCLAIPIERKLMEPGYVEMEEELDIEGTIMHIYCEKGKYFCFLYFYFQKNVALRHY